MDSYLDRLSTPEREKIRKRLRSPEAYEKLREKVKGPEDLEQELKRAEVVAEANFHMETEPHFKESVRDKVADEMQEQGIEEILESGDISPEAKKALESGNFDVAIDAHPETNDDQLMVIPEGTVAEKLPVKQNLGDQYLGQLLSS